MKQPRTHALLGIVALATAAVCPAAPARPADEPPPAVASSLRAVVDEELGTTVGLPAAGSYEIDVYGGVAAGVLGQEFHNDSEDELSVRLDSALPGEIEIVSLLLESPRRYRELTWEEEEIEEKAKKPARGSRAAAGTTRTQPKKAALHRLLSGSFTLPAGETVRLRTEFRAPVPFRDGAFRLTLPAVGGPQAGGSPPPLDVAVTIHHQAPLRDARSSSHEVIVDYLGDRTIVEPVQPEIPGDRPFELEFKTGTREEPTLVGYVRGAEDGVRTVEAMFAPPEAPEEGTARPKQVLFVIDTSGSMAQEEKLVQARKAVAQCYEKLRPEDRFNILEFDTDVQRMASQPVDPASFGADRVQAWLDGLTAGGGTTLLPGLDAALSQPEDPERHRILIVVTDGILSDEKPALDLMEEKLGAARLFVVGTGKRMRQETLLRLAEYGRGAATFAGEESQLGVAVAELFDSISDPLGWDLQLAIEGVEVEEILPSRLPDLYAGRPVRVLARVRGDIPSAMEVRMVTLDGERTYRVNMPPRR